MPLMVSRSLRSTMPETSKTIRLSGQFSWRDHKHITWLLVPLRNRLVIHGVVLLFVFIVISAFRPEAPIGPLAFAIFVVIYFMIL